MAFYSIVATAHQAVGLEKYMIAFDKGINVVAVTTNDIDTLVKSLKANGVTPIQIHRLDVFENVADLDILPLRDAHGAETE